MAARFAVSCLSKSIASIGQASITVNSANSVFLCRTQVPQFNPILSQARTIHNYSYVNQPRSTDGRNYRFKVHYPEDGKYTIRPLKVTKLGGRDPDTGRVIVATLGGGHKQRYRWLDHHRVGPKDGGVLEERIINIMYDPCKSAKVALVGSGNYLRYLPATSTMKRGDIIKTTSHLPVNPVRPKDNDAHPIGALPDGTRICCLEMHPGDGVKYVKSAGTYATIKKKIGNKVQIEMPSKRTFIISAKCMCTVGRMSNIDHDTKHIGSPNRLRWLGFRPRSGKWRRKTGFHGRKIKAIPKPREAKKAKPATKTLTLTVPSEMPSRRVIPKTFSFYRN